MTRFLNKKYTISEGQPEITDGLQRIVERFGRLFDMLRLEGHHGLQPHEHAEAHRVVQASVGSEKSMRKPRLHKIALLNQCE